MGPKTMHSQQVPSDADAAGLRTTLEEHLLGSWSSAMNQEVWILVPALL